MREFADITSFLRFAAGLTPATEAAGHRGVEFGAEIIRDAAKHAIGRENMSAGPFGAWEPLSDATMDGFYATGIGDVPGKTELGYVNQISTQDPLLRTGELYQSIECSSEGNKAAIGSDMDIAVYQELGTPDARFPIPPRSFLGLGAAREAESVADLIATHMVRAIAGMAPSNAKRPIPLG